MELKRYISKSLNDIYAELRKMWCISLHDPDLVGKRYVIEYDDNEEVFILMYYRR